MIAAQVLVFFLSLLHVSLAAPVTVWQTTTAVTNADGSQYTYNPDADATLAVAATAAPTAEASPAPSSSGSSIGSSIWSSFLNWLSSYSSKSSSSNSNSNSNSSSNSSSGLGFSFSSWLKGLFGEPDDSSSGSGSSSQVSSTPIATSSASTDGGWFGGQSSTSTSSTSSSKTSSGSGSTGGIYDEIYNSKQDIDVDFAKDILDAHNKYRAQHGVDDLSWDQDTYNYAKKNADDYDCSGVLTHTHGQFGENLAAGFSTGSSAVKAWYEEGETFNYNTYNEYNHFTQVVWKGSKKVGCAYKDCRKNNWGLYIVCEYDPVGNVIGQEQANVLRPVS